MKKQTRVLIIGGGATGTGLARDLALRGVECMLVEKRDIATGASGGNHGLLHSGARYVRSDAEAAVECREEGEILRRIAPQCIEDCGGMFVAVKGDPEDYIDEFPRKCEQYGIECRQTDLKEARSLEPQLSENIIAVYRVPDAAVDPFMLCLDNIAHARSLGAQTQRNARVDAFIIDGGRIRSVQLQDMNTGDSFEVEPEIVVNAAGAWAGLVSRLAGIEIPMLYSKGSLIITQDRLSRRVINRLRKASDADILVPGGTVSILGTTSVQIDDPDEYRPTTAEVDRMIDDARAMVPALDKTRYVRAYAGVRPLVKSSSDAQGREVSRGFSLVDHAENGVDNFITITGGKLTTFRLMAEKTADVVCDKLGVSAPCTTATEPLPASFVAGMTEPGLAVRRWLEKPNPDDVILCECEMVSRETVEAIRAELGTMRGRSMLNALRLRSRIGKGPCQGGFCGPRITSHLYDVGEFQGGQGVKELKSFIHFRWQGKVPILWGKPLMQAELQEAVHCGLMELEQTE